MSEQIRDLLAALSDTLAERVAAAAGIVVCIQAGDRRARSGILWRRDVVVGSQQVFPKAADAAEIVVADGRRVTARVAGRDPGTNVVALRLAEPIDSALAEAAAPRLGGLALALGADPDGAATVRLGVVRSLGPAWHSMTGGRIDRRVTLDFRVTRGEEGGPVLDAAGGLLGMSTGGPGGRTLVIPAATVERVLDPLLAEGRIARGWLGVALHPVALPDDAKAATGQDCGLMVMQVAADGPASRAGMLAGDILIAVDGMQAAHPAAIARRFGPDSIGREIEVLLIRSGASLTLRIAITARPAS